MLICGCCPCGASDCGAFGFSNERSLVYCASTFNWGGAASGVEPLPLVMKVVSWHRKANDRGPSGYHSRSAFHKDGMVSGGLTAAGDDIAPRQAASAPS